MKHYYALLLFCLSAVEGFAQTPTTFKHAFNFQVGDSFQYQFRKQVDDSYNSYSEGFLLYVITGVTQDTVVSYQTERHIKYTAVSNPLAYPPFTEGPPFSYSVADSNVWVLNGLTTIDTTGCSNAYDVVFANQDYEGRVQNEIVRNCFEHNWMRRYVEGLGQTDGSSFQSLGSAFWQGISFNLVYYHKANGGQWGVPQNFVLSAEEVTPEVEVSVYPSPATDVLLVQLSDAKQPVVFKLFDAVGRTVKEQRLTEISTIIARGDLPSGVYFWQIENTEKPLSHGKVVFR